MRNHQKNQVKEIDWRKSGFCLFTCKTSRRHDGPDGGACAGMNLGKAPEKEPILGHCTDQLRHVKYDAQEAGRENGNICGDFEARDSLGHLLPCLHGVRCLALLSLIPTDRYLRI